MLRVDDHLPGLVASTISDFQPWLAGKRANIISAAVGRGN